MRKRLKLKYDRRKRLKRRKDFWVRDLFQKREEKSEFHLLVQELRLEDVDYFFRLFRMSAERYEKLLSWVGPYLLKSNLD